MLSSPFFFPPFQSAARQARHDIITGTPRNQWRRYGDGKRRRSVRGYRASVSQEGSLWPSNVDQHRRVIRTRSRDFGLGWRYANNCSVGGHNMLPVTPDHSARLRHATVITIPCGAPTTFQDRVIEFFESDAASDLAVPTQSLCPYCADGVHETMCDWTLLQWTPQTAPVTMGASYSLDGRGVIIWRLEPVLGTTSSRKFDFGEDGIVTTVCKEGS